MSTIRLLVRHRAQAEIHELTRSEILLGSGEEADLIISHPSVARAHARLLVRRGRLVLVDLSNPGKITRIGPARLRAPAAVPERALFHLGEVAISGVVLPDRAALVGRVFAGFRAIAERPSVDPFLRRAIVARDDQLGELSVVESHAPEALRREWIEKVLASSHEPRPHLAKLAAFGVEDDTTFAIEALPAGLRLTALLDAMARGHVSLPIEARISILAQSAEAIASVHAAWGAHGALDGDAYHLGVDGSLHLVRPGVSRDYAEGSPPTFFAPERRAGRPPSKPADAWSLARLGKALERDRAKIPWPDSVGRRLRELGDRQTDRRPADLAVIAAEFRAAAHQAGLDPSTGHLARVVRLLGASRPPLASLRARP